MLGFDTIGNATLVVYDGEPLLATDPWIQGDAYFGSWGLSHAIPAEQFEAIRKAPFVWLSHGHPDHISLASIDHFFGAQILLADHCGARVRADLEGMGLRVRVLPDREWVALSPRVKIFTMADENQDSILLVDVGGRLVINLNDASPKLGERVIRPIARQYPHSYLLRLWGYGDADMINLWDETGRPIPSKPRDSASLSGWVQADTIRFQAKTAIPFSSFHRYQRADSVWANERTTPLADFYRSADPAKPPILPAFLRVDCESGRIEELNPPLIKGAVKSPEEFGDSPHDPLDREDQRNLQAYFERKESLRDHFGFLRFRVGGKDTTVDLNPKLREAGFSFEVPRHSLMTAIQYRVFDDLLIGNFMRTTLHGGARLYPHFTPFVSKYGDNGKAETKEELRAYFGHYRRKDSLGYALAALRGNSEQMVRRFVGRETPVFKAVKRVYWKMMKA